MQKVVLALGLAVVLSGCGGSGLFNPFSGARTAKIAQPGTSRRISLAPPRGYGFVRDNRPRAGQLSDARLEITPTGAILRATGRVARAGYWDAGLALVSVKNGVAYYELRARHNQSAQPGYPQNLTVATHLSRRTLAGLRRIEVRAAQGMVTLRP